MLAFSALENIRALIETVPLEKAADTYAKMMAGKARFGMVLSMNESAADVARSR
jgi:alcohol dehydrogenase, propanol-preferring